MAEAEAGLEIPIGVTEQRLAQQLARVEGMVIKAARKSEQQFVRSNQQITQSFGKMSNSARGQLQNVSFQLQDIFVQIAGGQGATRALAQQLPQLLGGFGALGAGIGVAVAAFPTLLGLFMDTADEAKELDEVVRGASEALKLLADAQDGLAVPVDELITKYGTLAATIRDALVNQLNDAGVRLREQSSALSSAFSDAIDIDRQRGSVEAVEQIMAGIDRALEQGIISQDEYNAKVAELGDRIQPTISVVDELDAALRNVADSQSLEGYAIAWASVRDFIEQNQEALEGSGVSVQDLKEKANDLTIEFGNAHAATMQIAPSIQEATNAAVGLQAEMAGVAVSAQQAAAAIQLAVGASFAVPDLKRFGNGEDITRRGGGLNLEEQDQFRRDWSAKMEALEKSVRSGGARSGRGGSRRRSGGGRSGRSGREERPLFENVERDLLQLERQTQLIGKSNEEVATAKARWELLDEAKKRGLPINDELNTKINAQASEVGRLTGELERAEIAQQQFDDAIDGIADAMAGALVAGESLRDGLAQVFKGIAADLIKSGIQRLLAGIIPGLLGGGDALTGALRGAGLPARAAGGPVYAGSPYMVGERGPEPFIPAVDGRILSVPQAQAALRGKSSGGSMSFSPSINIAGDASARTVALIENAIGRERERFFGQWVQAQKQFGNRMA